MGTPPPLTLPLSLSLSLNLTDYHPMQVNFPPEFFQLGRSQNLAKEIIIMVGGGLYLGKSEIRYINSTQTKFNTGYTLEKLQPEQRIAVLQGLEANWEAGSVSHPLPWRG
jgi:hypothetical protein